MTIQTSLTEAVKSLLLPVRHGQDEQCAQIIRDYLKEIGVEESDQAVWLKLGMDRWREENQLLYELKLAIEAYLRKNDAGFGTALSEKYFDLHKILMDEFSCSHQEASSFLSYSFLILDLAKNHSMSSSQISNVLASQAKNDKFTWDTIQKFLIKLGERQEVDEEQVKTLFAEDNSREERELADADLDTSIDIVAELGISLGFPGDLKNYLLALYESKETVHGPYLQILHYICITAHFYDNALSYLYEYSPRGRHAIWLFRQYEGKLDVPAGNAVLNNAKSVYRLDINWANSKKKKERLKARAVVHIVEGLEKMRFSQRKELVGWLRLWLHRVIRLHQGVETNLSNPTIKGIKGIIKKICDGETNTKGIIEQRVIDAIVCTLYPKETNWHPRGLGDSVNASNTSRKKFGDCEFLNPDKKEIMAFEVHAGKLSALYVEEHIRSIKKILAIRKDELESIADVGLWKLKVIFVAHELKEDIKELPPVKVDGLSIELRALRFTELTEGLCYDQGLADYYYEYVIELLNNNRTPRSVRKAYIALCAP